MVEIVNPGKKDYHFHSIVSDGHNSFDAIAAFADRMGLEKLAITDHSTSHHKAHNIPRKMANSITKRWQVANEKLKEQGLAPKVDIVFGVEADLLNVKGDVNFEPYSVLRDFIILSAHKEVFEGDPKNITEAYLTVLSRYHEKIDMIGHPCANYFSEHVDIEILVDAANHWEIPLELDCSNLVGGKTDLELLPRMLKRAHRVYVNSDGHTLPELVTLRPEGFKYLREHGFMK